nr:NADH-quinone oxidoreductase subunit L [Ardenticatenales bacterium]
SGFFSKDEILTLTQHAGATLKDPMTSANALYAIGLVTAFMTAFYSFRQFFMIFMGAPRTDAARHASESPAVMTVPLGVLALFAVLAGLVFGYPLEAGIFHHWLAGVIRLEHQELGAGAISTALSLGLSSVIALLGIGLAYLMYVSRVIDPAQISQSLAPLYRGSLNKWYVDETYQNTFVRFYNWLATWSARFVDRLIIDGAVNGVGALFGLLAGLLGRLQTGFVRSYALSIVLGLMLVAGYLYWQVDLTPPPLP